MQSFLGVASLYSGNSELVSSSRHLCDMAAHYLTARAVISTSGPAVSIDFPTKPGPSGGRN